MATVTVEVNGRPYAVGCADGQEERVRILAKQFDNQVRQVAGDVGHVGDLRLFLMSALILADELHEARLNAGPPAARRAGRRQQPVRGGSWVDESHCRVRVLAAGRAAGHGNGVGWAALCRLVTATHLRGHTPGSVALSFRDADGTDHLFSGDSLFPGGVGKTSGRADFEQLLGDVRSQLFDAFDDEAHVHPGHGDPTTLGQERPQLDEWAERGW